jgi:hypothetical protein
MDNKNFIKILTASLFILLLVLGSSCGKKVIKKPQLLQKISQVQNYTKIEVQPIISEKKETIIFKTKIETFQNQAFLEEDLTTVTLLEDNFGKPYQALQWKKEMSSDYSKTGILTFPYNKEITNIKLSFFDSEEIIFEWQTQETKKRDK